MSKITMVAIFVLVIFLSLSRVEAKRDNTERYYQEKHCVGHLEYTLEDKTRVDCLMPDKAVEYDFADKWAECAGQALYYASMTARHPVCALIIERESDMVYFKRLRFIQKAYCNLNLEIWTITNEEIAIYNSFSVCIASARLSIN